VHSLVTISRKWTENRPCTSLCRNDVWCFCSVLYEFPAWCIGSQRVKLCKNIIAYLASWHE